MKPGDSTLRRKLASILAAVALLAFGVVLYLAFIFPKTIAVWASEGQALSMVEGIAVKVTVFCQSVGFVLLPLLLTGVVGCAIWAAVSGNGSRNDSARGGLPTR